MSIPQPFGFCGPTYELRSINVESQRCINLYPEVLEESAGAQGKQPIALLNTPGLVALSPARTLSAGPVRGLWAEGRSRAFAVGGTKLSEITTGVSEYALAVGNNGDPVSFASNGSQLLIASNGNGFLLSLTPDTLAAVASGFGGAKMVAFLDGYFIALRPASRIFQISALLDGATWDALDVATVEMETSEVSAMIVDHRNLWLFGDRTSQAYYNSGNADFPIEPVPGGLIEQGILAPWSVCRLGGSVYWLGGDRDRGTGLVLRTRGLGYERISNIAIETIIQNSSGALDSIVGFGFSMKGHEFYVLVSLVGALGTGLVYDATTNLWHEWAYLNGSNYEAPLARCHAAGYATAPIHIVGSRTTSGAHVGKVYELSTNIYTDAGDTIQRERIAPHISPNMMPVFHHALHIDLDATAMNGSQLQLQWMDNGTTWVVGDTKTVTAGLTRLTWRRLGRAPRDRVYRVKWTTANQVAIAGAYIETSQALDGATNA